MGQDGTVAELAHSVERNLASTQGGLELYEYIIYSKCINTALNRRTTRRRKEGSLRRTKFITTCFIATSYQDTKFCAKSTRGGVVGGAQEFFVNLNNIPVSLELLK
jgi:hypothetical protein